MRPGLVAALGGLLVAVVLILSIGGSYVLSLHIIGQHDQVWCPILNDISAHRPPQVTAAEARSYAEIARVRRGLGCG